MRKIPRTFGQLGDDYAIIAAAALTSQNDSIASADGTREGQYFGLRALVRLVGVVIRRRRAGSASLFLRDLWVLARGRCCQNGSYFRSLVAHSSHQGVAPECRRILPVYETFLFGRTLTA